MLRWSVVDLARAAGVSVSSIRRLEEEVGTVQPRTRLAMRRALEGAGIDFIGTLDGMTGVILTRDRRGA